MYKELTFVKLHFELELESQLLMENNYVSKNLFFGVVIVVFAALGSIHYTVYKSVIHQDGEQTSDSYDNNSSCTVMGLNLHGTIRTYAQEGAADEGEDTSTEDVVASQDIVSAIWAAGDDPDIQAVLLEVDSYGGAPVAGEEIANALKALGKPSVAVIRQGGASAAYWAASGADYIVASENSDVGSIGVTMSYLENIDKTKKYIQLSSGKYKDAGDPDRPLADDEKAVLLRDVKIIHENFIKSIAKNRNIEEEEVRKIADGSSVLGAAALSLKLIDEIGSWSEAEKYLEQRLGEKPIVCW